MALTLEAEQRLIAAGLSQFFDARRAGWLAAVRDTHTFLRRKFPAGAAIRPDDVAKVLKPIVEVDQALKAELNRRKLRQRYWIADFVDLMIERTWDDATRED